MNRNQQLDPAKPRWLIAADIGNHGIKIERRPGDRPVAASPGPRLTISSAVAPPDSLANWLPAEPAYWLVATVRRDAQQRLAQWVRQHRPQDAYCRLTQPMVPIPVDLDNPGQVGVDRLLAAFATLEHEPDRCDRIVVDAGSAITVDRVSSEGVFEGGAIFPGLGMMGAMLARQTDQLPEIGRIAAADLPPVVGRSTVAAIQSGLYWGTVGAVRELVRRMSAEAGERVPVFVTGGDGGLLAPPLGLSVRHVSNLVLDGIVATYRHPRHEQRIFPGPPREGAPLSRPPSAGGQDMSGFA